MPKNIPKYGKYENTYMARKPSNQNKEKQEEMWLKYYKLELENRKTEKEMGRQKQNLSKDRKIVRKNTKGLGWKMDVRKMSI